MLASKGGVISEAMKAIHLIPQKANLFSNDYFVWVYVFSGIWQSMGWNSIIYIAALSSVDTQLYDACKIDGANRWQTDRKSTRLNSSHSGESRMPSSA